MIMERRFIINPLFTISGILKYPEPNTTAFGGVATGSIKAHEAATAAATMRTKGCISTVRAMGAKTGSNMAVVAKLDVISVKKLTAAMSNRIKIIVVTPTREVIWFPIHNANPLFSKPLARAIPPPNRMMMPQGSFLVSSHVINR